MENILSKLSEIKDFEKLRTAVLNGVSCAFFGADKQKPYFIEELIRVTNKKFFIIVPDESRAQAVYETLSGMMNGTLIFPAKDLNLRRIESVSRFDENTRISALTHILKKDFIACVIPADALCALVSHPDEHREITVYKDETVSFENFIKQISDFGYKKYDIVEGPGQYSVRGGIVDIFLPNENEPYRIEFFGDDIDSVSVFDPDTQRRTEPKDYITIYPVSERCAEIFTELEQTLKKHTDNKFVRPDLELIENGILPEHDRYLPLNFKKTASILDYITDGISVCIFDWKECRQTIDGYAFRAKEDIKTLIDEGYFFLKKDYFFTPEEIISKIKAPLIFETLPCSIRDFPVDIIGEVSLFPTEISTMLSLSQDVDRFISEGYSVYVLTTDKAHTEELKKELKSDLKLHILQGTLPYGFSIPEIKMAVFTYRRRFAQKKKRVKFEKGEKIKNFSDIVPGDYVVHEDYGIAVYSGIHKVESQGVINDYIKLNFAGTDVLYIPCSQLNKISKYISANADIKVKLNKLGTSDWTKTKQKVRSSVRDLAEKLTKLYGQRLNIKGIAFSPDNEWQRDFEANFEFEETEDQLRCIDEIKKDMEKPVPMDRLLCGDVGFGKTEVALRAIFKAVNDGKQVAFLAPTTILSFQHYKTMVERFGEYPVKTALLSRFRSTKQQKETLLRLKRGEIDVVIGTHRLLQKDVEFKDLGLIVVDEEQRFGVMHKEYLKELAKNADVLTLSATPIPRTLNMSMSGIRDISVLNEPPHNRFPVTTYVAEYDIGLIIDAIKREVMRGGQCYYLHNRIESIYKVAGILREKTGFNIQVAHGKMTQEELSSVWESLVAGDIDVLVCTTIIETGVDVPNCNTLIIEDADRLGLAQLHQIRGRVGRTDRRAYAYFTFRKGKVLNSEAYKRLMTIKEFTEFGSGLKIAMRDLEIRGAGDILGAEQSGHLMSVGFDLYMKMLEQAVHTQKGESQTKTECAVEIKINAYIPDSYIRNTETRIEVYKMIAGMFSQEDYSDILDELIDRFGDPPADVMNLMRISRIRMTAGNLGICEISEEGKNIKIVFETQPSWDIISDITAPYRRRLLFSVGKKPYFTLKPEKDTLDETEQFLNTFTKVIDKARQ